MLMIICMNGHDRRVDKTPMNLYFKRAAAVSTTVAAEASSGHANVTLAELVSEPQKTPIHYCILPLPKCSWALRCRTGTGTGSELHQPKDSID